ncbi:MAG TPA: SDR family NAD(P)-dependent oxidoreductase [Candidatus Binatia bacterium]|nr:SDR family NAD(P)-dependent oxidoreductase [Candidatus Binatia bacterium]
MDLELKGKVAFITGGASGLGKCTAETMAAEGVSVMLADVNESALEATRSALLGLGVEAEAVRLDVRDLGACRRAIDETVARFGKLDILVNSAGIGGSASFFVQTDPQEWQDLIGINLLGVMNCCRAASAHMIERRYGKIVSIASEAGRANEKRMVVYGATKGGVISLTRGLALELGRSSINVNAVCPGVTRTPMTAYIDEEMEKQAARFYPLGRLGQPEDIAPMITFLCSDRASWITGQAISISGGFGRY